MRDIHTGEVYSANSKQPYEIRCSWNSVASARAILEMINVHGWNNLRLVKIKISSFIIILTVALIEAACECISRFPRELLLFPVKTDPSCKNSERKPDTGNWREKKRLFSQWKSIKQFKRSATARSNYLFVKNQYNSAVEGIYCVSWHEMEAHQLS